MKKLRILKDSLMSTWFFSLVTVLSLALAVVIISITYNNSFGKIQKDVIGYDENLKNYTVVDFASYKGSTNFKELSEKMDMTGYAGVIYIGDVVLNEEAPEDRWERMTIQVLTPSMSQNVNTNGLEFSKDISSFSKEAYVTKNYQQYYQLGQYYDFSFNQGIYEYKVKVKIIGYVDEFIYNNYKVTYTEDFGRTDFGLMICDYPPDYMNIENGIMINDKTPEYYQKLGVEAKTLQQVNDMNKTQNVNIVFLYFCIGTLILILVVIFANYYLSADKILKRFGVMFICGEKRQNLIFIELVKMLLLFVFAIALSSLILGVLINILSKQNLKIVTWNDFGITVGLIFVLYMLSIAIGFIKIAKSEPLKSISQENLE